MHGIYFGPDLSRLIRQDKYPDSCSQLWFRLHLLFIYRYSLVKRIYFWQSPIEWSNLYFQWQWNYQITIVSNSERFACTCSIADSTGIIVKQRENAIAFCRCGVIQTKANLCALCKMKEKYEQWRHHGNITCCKTCTFIYYVYEKGNLRVKNILLLRSDWGMLKKLGY